MANQEHLKRLLQGVAEWNEWRRTTGVTCPDLSGAQLGYEVLIGANLRRVDLRGAGLIGTDLSGADLTDADLRFTNRVDAILNNETILPDGSRWAPSKQLLPSQPGHKPRVVGKIFISYRREDSQWQAWTIYKSFCRALSCERCCPLHGRSEPQKGLSEGRKVSFWASRRSAQKKEKS